MSNDGKKNWDRPWSTEEIIQNADNWNLACDAALLNTLEAFGQKVISKTDEVHKKVDNLCNDLEEAGLNLDFARNAFNSLRNSKFVECRVYEEDETLPSVEKTKADDVPSTETVEDLKEAVALGLEVLDDYFEKVEVTLSDSEDEDEQFPSHVYRRKDLYLDRPLPYVIGSEMWYKKWHVGLRESSDSEKSSEKFSNSDDEDESDAKNQCEDLEPSNLKPVGISTANNTLRDDTPQVETSVPSAMPNFAEQLAAKLGHVKREKEEEVNRRPIQKKSTDYGALFSDEPPSLDEGLVKQKESDGIFSGGKGLFDEEEEEDLWNPVQGKPKDGLFDEDSDNDIFASAKKPDQSKPYLQPKKPIVPIYDEKPPTPEIKKKKPAGGVSIFNNSNITNFIKQKRQSSDESSDDDQTTKQPTTSEVAQPEHKTTTHTSKSALFDDDLFEDDLFSSKTTSILFGSSEDLPKATEIANEYDYKLKKNDNLKKVDLFEDDDDDLDIFKPTIVQEDVIKQPVLKDLKQSESEPKKGIFDDEYDDLFKPSVAQGNVEAKKIGLFDDFEDTDDLFSEILNKEKIVEPKSDVKEVSESAGDVPWSLQDCIPPPDDGSDNNSDLFDDFDGYNNDDFQSQPSGLFDNEPPLFSKNTSDNIVTDKVQNSLDVVEKTVIKPDLFDEIDHLYTLGEDNVQVPTKQDVIIDKSMDQSGSAHATSKMQRSVSEIAENLKTSLTFENRPKSAPAPKKLAHNLNINVGALLPGSAPPRRVKSEEKQVVPSQTESPPTAESPPPVPVLRSVSDTNIKKEKSISFEDDVQVEILQSVTKNRVRIPVKRRPSSRRARQEQLKNSISDFTLHSDETEQVPDSPSNEIAKRSVSHDKIKQDSLFSDDSDNDLFKIPKAQETIKVSGNSKTKDDLFNFFDDDDNLFGAESKAVLKPSISSKAKNLFDSSDEDDDFLKPPNRNKNSKEQPTSRVKSLFSDDDDDDIFATASNKVKKEIQSSVINKNVPKSNSGKLESIEGNVDPLSALLD